MSKGALKPLPCPFCGAELERWESRSQFDSPRWNHPKALDCPLAQMPAALGDPFFVFDHPSEINAWNARPATPPQRTEQKPVSKYCCHACFDKSGQAFLDRMILCPECGNKRCPKATNHELQCTGPAPVQPLTDEQKNSERYLFLRNNANAEKAESAWRAVMSNRGALMDECIDAAIAAAQQPAQPCCMNYAAGNTCFSDPRIDCPHLQPAQRKPLTEACDTCIHCHKGKTGIHSFNADVCRQCCHYFDSKYEG